MAWTTPATWVVGNVLEAADLNEQLRDNMSYVHSGKPATAIAHNDGANYTPGASFADVDATDLAVTLSITTGRVLVTAQCLLYAGTGDAISCWLDVEVDGSREGGTQGLSAATAGNGYAGVGFSILLTGLSVGSHTFKLQAKATYGGSGGTGCILADGSALVHFSAAEW